MPRADGRASNALRPVRLTPDFVDYPEGSVLIEMGQTRVLCNVSVDESVPPFLRGQGRGWLTAEYSLLPRSTHTRTAREAAAGRLTGRTQEIQRLIGRSLRAAVDLESLGERTLLVDCDVLQADGGTRTAAITGAYVAVVLAVRRLIGQGLLKKLPIIVPVAAVSVGVIDGVPCLDLDYREDSRAGVDCNVVMTGKGDYVEVQGTAEGKPFDHATLLQLLDLATEGCRDLIATQRRTLGP